MKNLLLVLLLLYPLSALAETYEYTDAQGTLHFADDLGNVPKKYRKKARLLGAESDSAVMTVIPEAATSKPANKGAEKKVYGGKDEQAWRRAFGEARLRVKAEEDGLASLRGRLVDTSKMSRQEYLNIQATIAQAEIRLKDAQRQLDTLDQTATQNDVPAAWRQ